MLRRKFYPAATKYLLQAIEKWDGDDQDLAQVWLPWGNCFWFDLTFSCIALGNAKQHHFFFVFTDRRKKKISYAQSYLMVKFIYFDYCLRIHLPNGLMLVHCILESLQSVTAILCLCALTHQESCLHDTLRKLSGSSLGVNPLQEWVINLQIMNKD